MEGFQNMVLSDLNLTTLRLYFITVPASWMRRYRLEHGQ